MESYIFLIYVMFAAISCSESVPDSTRSSFGKEFVFAFFPTSANPATSSLANDVYISAPSDSDCTLSYDEGSGRQRLQIHVPANTIKRSQLPDDTQMSVNNTVDNKGIHLNCTHNVWAYVYNRYPLFTESSDSYTILPVQMLSTNYIIPGMNNNPIFGIVATSPNTTVTIYLTSTCKTQNFQDGYVLYYTLNAYDVVQIMHRPFTYMYRMDYDCDFGGTKIHATSPVAVFSGSIFYFVDSKVGSHLMLQVPPVGAYSFLTIVPHLPSPASVMTIRVLTAEDNANVYVTSHTTGTTAKTSSHLTKPGDFVDFNFTANVDAVVRSDKPVMVVQNVFFYPGRDGGLSMFIPGIADYGTDYIIQSLSHDQYNHLYLRKPVLTIVSETLEISGIDVNGKPPAAMQWAGVSGTNYSVGTMAIDEVQKYNIHSTTPILVKLHQYVGRESYGFIGRYISGDSSEDNKSYVTISGQIYPNTPIHINLFKNASFHTPLTDTQVKAQLGHTMYVQVDIPNGKSLNMIVNSCQAYLTDDVGNTISHPLISLRCPVDKNTEILSTSSHITRFEFDIYHPSWHVDVIYVTCDVTFCNARDDSPKCDHDCHSDHSVIGK